MALKKVKKIGRPGAGTSGKIPPSSALFFAVFTSNAGAGNTIHDLVRTDDGSAAPVQIKQTLNAGVSVRQLYSKMEFEYQDVEHIQEDSWRDHYGGITYDLIRVDVPPDSNCQRFEDGITGGSTANITQSGEFLRCYVRINAIFNAIGTVCRRFQEFRFLLLVEDKNNVAGVNYDIPGWTIQRII